MATWLIVVMLIFLIVVVVALIVTSLLLLAKLRALQKKVEDEDRKIDSILIPASVNSLIAFVKNNTLKAGNVTVPRSYNVAPEYFENLVGYREEDFLNATNIQRYNKFTAIFNQENIINTYDSSVWAIVLARIDHQDQVSYDNAFSWLKYLAFGTSPLKTNFQLMASKPNSNFKFYNTSINWPDGEIGTIGFGFRGLPIRGYSSEVAPLPCALANSSIGGSGPGNDFFIDPLVYAGCQGDVTNFTKVDTLSYTWSDFRCVSGEAAWTLLACCHMINAPLYRVEKVLPSFIARLVNTLVDLECGSQGGAIYYSPQLYQDSTHTVMINPGWDQLSFSTENMCSIVAALHAVNKTTALPSDLRSKALALAERTTNFVVNQCVKLTPYEYDNNTGGTKTVPMPSVVQGSPSVLLGTQPVANGKQFAVDCFTWLISVFGNALERRQTNLCLNLWKTLKTQCGVFVKGDFVGFGYSFVTPEEVVSGEWSLGAIFAARSMLILYSSSPSIVLELKADIEALNKTIFALYAQTPVGTGVFYSNKQYAIPFGWIAQKNASMASTTWQIFNLVNFNPFNLDGSFNFVV